MAIDYQKIVDRIRKNMLLKKKKYVKEIIEKHGKQKAIYNSIKDQIDVLSTNLNLKLKNENIEQNKIQKIRNIVRKLLESLTTFSFITGFEIGRAVERDKIENELKRN